MPIRQVRIMIARLRLIFSTKKPNVTVSYTACEVSNELQRANDEHVKAEVCSYVLHRILRAVVVDVHSCTINAKQQNDFQVAPTPKYLEN
jgi:hypothetical protein